MGWFFLFGLIFCVVRLASAGCTAFVSPNLGKGIKTWGTVGLVVFIVVAAVPQTMYTTNDQQIGFVNQFGINTPYTKSGLKFKIPFISSAKTLDARTKSMTIGYVELSDDVDSEEFETTPGEAIMITKDFNFIEIDFIVQYKITDAIEYTYATNDPEEIFRDCILTAIKNNVGLTPIDDVLTTGKAILEANIRDSIIEELKHHETGISLVSINMQDTTLPNPQVEQAFKDVEDAKQEAESKVSQAEAYRNTEIPKAEAKASEVLSSAEASRTERVNQAYGEVAEFEAIYDQYKESPVVKDRLYYTMLEDIIPGMEVIISNDGKMIYVKNDNTSVNAGTASAIKSATTDKNDTKSDSDTASESKKH